MDIFLMLRGNIERLLNAGLPAPSPDEFPRPRDRAELAAQSGVSKSTVYLLLGKKGGPPPKPYTPSLDKLERLAAAFGLPAWALLVPNLDPENPPVSLTQADFDRRVEEEAHALVQRASSVKQRLERSGSPADQRGVDVSSVDRAAADKQPTSSRTNKKVTERS